MSTTRLFVRPERANKDGECVIFVRYTHNQKSILLTTGEKIKSTFWDKDKSKLRKGFRGYDALNAAIQNEKVKIDNIARFARSQNIDPALEYVKDKYFELKVKNNNEEFFDLLDGYIKKQKKTNAVGSIKQYESFKKRLERFSKEKKIKITLEKINSSFYDQLMDYFIDELEFSNTTFNNLVSYLRLFLNYLTVEGLNKKMDYKRFKSLDENIDMICLSEEELYKILNADIEDKQLEHTRDVFIFGCATGLRYSDIRNLKPENIKADGIHLTIQKTKDSIIVPLNNLSRQVLEKYKGGIILTSSPSKTLRALPIVMLSDFNENIKSVAKLAKVNDLVQKVRFSGAERIEKTYEKHELLSSHAMRRTFVTLSLEKGMRPETVMSITNHKDYDSFKKYIKLTNKIKQIEIEKAWDIKQIMKVAQ
jgi:integrase